MVFLSEQSALYVVVLVCLALVLMMAITLILMFRRSATAEKQVKEMAANRERNAKMITIPVSFWSWVVEHYARKGIDLGLHPQESALAG